jgi:hypothetical protein
MAWLSRTVPRLRDLEQRLLALAGRDDDYLEVRSLSL